jgi:hypothetical protein
MNEFRFFFCEISIDFKIASWLEYRSDCKRNHVPTIKQLDLCYFRLDIVECLLSEEKAEPRSRGRPSEASLSAEQPCIKHRCEVSPPTAVCLDTVDHLPSKDNNEHSSRCKNQNCMKKTHTCCKKCNSFMPNKRQELFRKISYKMNII